MKKAMRRLFLFCDLFIFCCILFSCVLILLEILFPEQKALWHAAEFLFAGIFIIEYLVRWTLASDRIRYPFTLYALIDLLAILPSFLLLSGNFMFLRLFRAARFLRILKLARYNEALVSAFASCKNNYIKFKEIYKLDHLGRLFFLCVFSLVVGANLLYVTEAKFAPAAGPYSDYWKSYWNIIIVLISGIEDKEPISFAGKVEVTLLLIAGICVVGMITAEIISILMGKLNRKGKIALKSRDGVMDNHIVILGANRHLDYIIRQLHIAFHDEYHILVVAENAGNLPVTIPPVYKKVMALEGDPLLPGILHMADIPHARRVVVLSPEKTDPDAPASGQAMAALRVSDNLSLMTALAVDSIRPDIPVTAQIRLTDTEKYSGIIRHTDFVISKRYHEKLISQAVFNPGVTRIYRSLMTFSPESNEFYRIPISDEWEGKRFSDLQAYWFERDEPVIPVGYTVPDKSGQGETYHINPLFVRPSSDRNRDASAENEDPVLSSDSRLIVLAYEHPDYGSAERRFFLKRFLPCSRPAAKTPNLLPPVKYCFERGAGKSILVCHFNPHARHIVEELLSDPEDRIDITLILPPDTDIADVRASLSSSVHSSSVFASPGLSGTGPDHLRIITGDPADLDVLEKAGVHQCCAAIILADPRQGNLADAASTLVAMSIERLNPDIHTIMELINSVNREYINEDIINEVVCLGDITEKLVAQNCCFPGVIRLFDLLLTYGKDTPQVLLPRIPAELAGRSYHEIYRIYLEQRPPFIIIGYISDRRFIINPRWKDEWGVNHILTQDDQLILIARDFSSLQTELSPDTN